MNLSPMPASDSTVNVPMIRRPPNQNSEAMSTEIVPS
ncbi:hypothetical protein ABIF41_001392 [Bradyrhizobium japonicum]